MRLSSASVFLFFLTIGYAQPAPTDAPVGAETVLGIPVAEYRQTQEILLEANDDPEVAALNRQIERLMEKRDKLMFAKAKAKHPNRVANINVVENEVEKRRGPKPTEAPKPGN